MDVTKITMPDGTVVESTARTAGAAEDALLAEPPVVDVAPGGGDLEARVADLEARLASMEEMLGQQVQAQVASMIDSETPLPALG